MEARAPRHRQLLQNSRSRCWEETIQHLLLGKKWRREEGHHTINFGLPLPDACKRQPSLIEKSWPICQRRGQIHEIHRYEGDLIDEPQSTVSAISKSEKLWPNLKFESGMKEFIIVSTTNSTPSTYFGFRQCNKIEESTISQNGCKSQERSSLWSLRYKSNLCS